jgi:hypothetical protein
MIGNQIDLRGQLKNTTGNLILSSSVGSLVAMSSALKVDGEIYGYKAFINLITASSYNLPASDSGKVVEMSNSLGTGGFIYLPNFLSSGFCCTFTQASTGTFTFSASAGATLKSYTNLTKSAGENAQCSLYVRSNANGSSAVYILRREFIINVWIARWWICYF